MLYFAYGSNLDAEQMLRRCPGARIVDIAELPNHALCFAGFSAMRAGAVASVTPRSGMLTPGLVYAMPQHDLEALDRYEGHPVVYQRLTRVVTLSDGRRARAQVYVHRSPRFGGPGREYLRIIRRAYRDLGFDSRALSHAAWGLT